MKRVAKIVILIVGIPITYLSSIWLKFIRNTGYNKITDKIFMNIGILPILDNYYSPLINPQKHLLKSLRDDRNLPGIDLNIEEQLKILSQFNFNEELLQFPLDKTDGIEFYYENIFYKSGDAEYLYNMIRLFKPGRIIEIGSGFSTLMARNAIDRNTKEDSNYTCHHVSIEPYEQPWLEKLNIEVIRERVESIDISFFQSLEKNDILFIDSSHIIRSQGDVLYEYLELLPSLKSGVLIHIHDIFTPKDYLDSWVFEEHYLWNEQYLLEAFLSCNPDFRIIGALNYLTHHYPKEITEKCPVLGKQAGREPGAFWLIKV